MGSLKNPMFYYKQYIFNVFILFNSIIILILIILFVQTDKMSQEIKIIKKNVLKGLTIGTKLKNKFLNLKLNKKKF